MTDYNDGKWHGWNGGECPVHPKSHIEVITRQVHNGKTSDGNGNILAEGYHWDHDKSWYPVVAFRVIKPYVEPLEFWAAINKNGDAVDLCKDKGPLQGYNYHKIIKVREVSDDPS